MIPASINPYEMWNMQGAEVSEVVQYAGCLYRSYKGYGAFLSNMYFLIEKGKFVFSNAFIAEGKVSLCFNQPPEIFTKFCSEKSFFLQDFYLSLIRKKLKNWSKLRERLN